MSRSFNWLLSNYALTASGVAVPTSDIECNPGEVAFFEVLVESVSGGPSAAALACACQIAPINAKGYNINSYPSSDQQQWQTVTAADGFTGHLLLDGAWPTSLADQTLSVWRSVSRRLLIPPIGRQARLNLTPTFTGGSSPSFRVTVGVGVYKP